MSDGDTLDIGPAMRLRALATPGHTFTHLSYVLEAGGRGGRGVHRRIAAVRLDGRPDLLGPASTGPLARAQHGSAQRLARELPDSAEIFPTHGFGSFCAATQAQAAWSTIGREKQLNPALTLSEPDLRRGAAGRPGRLPGLLRPHGPGEPGRARAP